MNHALVVGGANGIGLAVALKLSGKFNDVTIIDRVKPDCTMPPNINYRQIDLATTDFEWLVEYSDVDGLFYSAGFGRVAHFEELRPKEIDNSFTVNTIAPLKILSYYMPRLKSCNNFYCGVMVSIAARIASPLFSVYSATKAALFRAIEAINIEIEMSGGANRILEVSPGSIKGTRFNGSTNNLILTEKLATDIVTAIENRQSLLIPDYEQTFKSVIDRYNDNAHEFGLSSYRYKIDGGRLSDRPQLRIGYLSGTFDLFHIGHLNLLRRAKMYCDYLVVGVHRDGSHKGKNVFIPFEERMEIVKNISFVDRVIESEREDSDVYTKGIVHYDLLFVGSDYKGTERFNRYEEYFKDKGVEIVYFPYTKGTSSTQLRTALSEQANNV